MSNKKVVYTCIFGDYDILNEPIVVNNEWEYICFTDSKITSKTWKILPIPPNAKIDLNSETMALFELSNQKVARKIKLNPHIFLSNYDTTIWIDGNLQIKTDPEELLLMYYKNDFCVASHPDRICTFQELQACLHAQKESHNNISKLWTRYEKEKLPKNLGMIQSGMIIRNNKSKDVIQINEKWWEEVKQNSHRDQLSFNYVLWKYKHLDKHIHLFSSRVFINEFNMFIHGTNPPVLSEINSNIQFCNYSRIKNYINGKEKFNGLEYTERDIAKYKKILIDDLLRKVGDTHLQKLEYEFISNKMGKKNVLIFGRSFDDNFWRFSNTGGKMIFIENNPYWIDPNRPDIVKVNYTCSMPQADSLLEEIKNGSYENLLIDLPESILKEKWDVIFLAHFPCTRDARLVRVKP